MPSVPVERGRVPASPAHCAARPLRTEEGTSVVSDVPCRRPLFRVRVEIKLELRLGKDNCALVAAFRDQRTRRLPDRALLAHQFFAYPRVVGRRERGFGNSGLANGFGHIPPV